MGSCTPARRLNICFQAISRSCDNPPTSAESIPRPCGLHERSERERRSSVRPLHARVRGLRLSLQRVAAQVPRAWKIPLPSTPALRAPFRGRPLLYQRQDEQRCLPAHVSAIEALGLPGYASSSAPFYFGGLILPCSLAVWDLPRRPGRGGWTGCLPGLARDAHGAPSAPLGGGPCFQG